MQKKLIKPITLGGFKDYNQKEAIIRDRLIIRIKKVYETFGFEPIETPCIENTQVLNVKDTDSRMIMFQTSLITGKKILEKDAGSLRFDLTTSLAKFTAANPELIKPLKIYQIGKVWRGERQQKGRYREFLQIDADILGSSSILADTEIIILIYKTLKELGLKDFTIKINNRKILNQLPEFLGIKKEKTKNLLQILDDWYKLTKEEKNKQLKKIKAPKNLEQKLYEFTYQDIVSITNEERLKRVEKLFEAEKFKEAQEGIKELREIVDNLKLSGIDEQYFEIDLSIVRGLGYYTGPVFETYLKDRLEIGSIMSGGRYNNLVSKFSNMNIPAVGVSLGFDRLFSILNEQPKPITKVLILWLDTNLKKAYFKIVAKLRENNINSEIYLGDEKAFNAQLNYAIKKEIPLIILYGEKEAKNNIIQMKNLLTRQQWQVKPENLIEEVKKSLLNN